MREGLKLADGVLENGGWWVGGQVGGPQPLGFSPLDLFYDTTPGIFIPNLTVQDR